MVGSMEDLDTAREKAVLDLGKGPLPNAVKELEHGCRQLPTDQDFHFYLNFREFQEPVVKLQSRVVSLLSQLGSLKEPRSHPSTFPAEFDEDYDWLVGVQDDFLERVDASLDKFQLERKDQYKQKTGLNAFEASSKQNLARKASHTAAATEDTKNGAVKVARSKDKATLRSPIPFHIRSIPRPQDKFDDAVDNSNTPFKHQASKRRNQQESQVSTSKETAQSRGDSSTVSTASVLEQHARKLGHGDSAQNTHPLEEELTKMAYVEALLDTAKIRKYKSLDGTPFTLVTALKALKEMAAKIRIAGEIAVDLENHHYRSYQGFVCLMQVSTRDEDFIVDTLDLRSQIGPCLGDIFSDPTIRKVMHGADHDIVWLQRDFGIYVCNLFDTGQAARVLQLKGFGLAFLLEHFCDVHADKRYQLADWRIRPLPLEMIKYAREDTHYLLYIHDMLKQELLNAKADAKVDEDNPFIQVYKRSRDICLLLYAKELFTETSYQHIYGLPEKKFRPEQLAVLAGLYAWRDHISRKEDESTGYVLPNHLLFLLASEMPNSVHKLQSIVKGSYTLVGSNAKSIIEIIVQAKEKALREHKDRHPEHEEAEQEESTLRKDELNGGKARGAVSKIVHSEQSEGTSTKFFSPQSEGQKTETTIFSNKLQADNFVKPSETGSTSAGISSRDRHGSESMSSDKANVSEQVVKDALPEVRLGVGQLKLTPEILTGPVVVSRRTSSSFFNSRPRKTPSVPLPSTYVSTPKELLEISEVQHPPTALLSGPTVPIGNPPHIPNQAMAEAFTTEHSVIKFPDEPQGSYQTKERRVSEKFLASDAAGKIEETQTSIITFVPRGGAGPSSSDLPFNVPEISSPQVSLRQAGNDSEVHVSVISMNETTIPARVQCEKVPENAVVVQAKRKPSKLAGLLGSRKRVQQVDHGQSAKELDQARSKTQDIESSMVLPFSHPALVTLDISRMDAQHPATPATGEAKIITGIPEEKMDDGNEKLKGETSRPLDSEGLETLDCSSSLQAQDVLMLDLNFDESRPIVEKETIVSNGTIIGTDLAEPTKHRVWWHAADSPSLVRGRDSSTLPSDLPLDQLFDTSEKDGSSQLSLSLSEMYRISKRRSKLKSHPEDSRDNVNPDVAAELGSGRRFRGKKKRQRETPSSTEDGAGAKREKINDNKVDFRSFNYRDARKILGLDNLYTHRADDRQEGTSRGRGRVLKKGNKQQGIPVSKTAFDPLRRVRQESRPEGKSPGKRRQVFPQSGNRTAVFRK